MHNSIRFIVFSILAITFFACIVMPVHAQQDVVTQTMEEILKNLPISLDTEGTTQDGYQAITDIPLNLERLYGVGCVFEVPFIEKNRQEPFPSRNLDYTSFEIKDNTTLREFLDKTCSDGKMRWSVIHNAIHIQPTTTPTGNEEYLDTVVISLDLQGVSILKAAKNWAQAINKNKNASSSGVWTKHPARGADFHGKYHATPASLTRENTVTLKIDNVTAREALCAIQGASKEWTRIYYLHATNSKDNICLFPSKNEFHKTPEINSMERKQLDEEEDLDSGCDETDVMSVSDAEKIIPAE